MVAEIQSGLEQSLRAGVTAIGEIATQPCSVYRSASPCAALVLFHEIIAFSRARADSARTVLQHLEGRWPLFYDYRTFKTCIFSYLP